MVKNKWQRWGRWKQGKMCDVNNGRGGRESMGSEHFITLMKIVFDQIIPNQIQIWFFSSTEISTRSGTVSITSRCLSIVWQASILQHVGTRLIFIEFSSRVSIIISHWRTNSPLCAEALQNLSQVTTLFSLETSTEISLSIVTRVTYLLICYHQLSS